MNRSDILGYGLVAAGAVMILSGFSAKNEFPVRNDATSQGSDGSQVSYTPEVYANMAAELFSAMDRFFVDKVTVFRILESMQSRADLEKLIFVFGTRTRSSLIIFKNDYNLNQWLKESFSGADLDRLRVVFTRFNIPF